MIINNIDVDIEKLYQDTLIETEGRTDDPSVKLKLVIKIRDISGCSLATAKNAAESFLAVYEAPVIYASSVYGNTLNRDTPINPVNEDILEYAMVKCNVQTDKTVTLNTVEGDALFYAWVSDNTLRFFPKVDKYLYLYKRITDIIKFSKVDIPFESIIDFAEVGEKYREQIIRGGGGGGVNVSGALIGGLLFGATGAIIGSREKVEEVKSETIEHDTRRTALRFKINGKEITEFFSIQSYQIFEDLIPQYEKSAVKRSKTRQANAESESIILAVEERKKGDDFEILKQLKQLYDTGILTEEEFTKKKQQVLERM